MSAENPKYWGIEGDDVLTHTDIADRLQDYIEQLDPEDEMPDEMEMVGFDPMHDTIDIDAYAESVLNDLLEQLDENYSTSLEESTEPTDGMKVAALTFIKKINELYTIKDCQQVCKKTVKVWEYLDKEDYKDW